MLSNCWEHSGVVTVSRYTDDKGGLEELVLMKMFQNVEHIRFFVMRDLSHRYTTLMLSSSTYFLTIARRIFFAWFQEKMIKKIIYNMAL